MQPWAAPPSKACWGLLPILVIPVFYINPKPLEQTHQKKKKDKSIYFWEENHYQNSIHTLAL